MDVTNTRNCLIIYVQNELADRKISMEITYMYIYFFNETGVCTYLFKLGVIFTEYNIIKDVTRITL